MAKKRIFQLGLEAHYAANAIAFWYEGELKGNVRVRRAKAEGLVVFETEDVDLADKMIKSVNAKVAIKEVEV